MNMKRFAAVAALIVLAAALPAAAQSPSPHPTGAVGMKKIPASSLANPANRHTNPNTMSGSGCISGGMANAAQTRVNPINGKAQAAPIVSIPISKGSGSVASATTHAQQTQACAQTR
jgi:hypothetical protein